MVNFSGKNNMKLLKLYRGRRDKRDRALRLVGGGFNNQENLYMRLILGGHSWVDLCKHSP